MRATTKMALLGFLAMSTTCNLAHAGSAEQYIDDASITAKVKSALLSDSQLKALKITVVTNDGSVELSGSAENKNQEAEAIKDANQVDGVRSVKDKLNVSADTSE